MELALDTVYTLSSSDGCTTHINLDYPDCFDLYVDGSRVDDGEFHEGEGSFSWQIELRSKTPESGSAGGSGGAPESGSFKWNVSMGVLGDGSSAGTLFLYGEEVDGSYYSPSALQLSANAEVLSVVTDNNGALRQVISEEVIADIVTIDGYRYEIRFYELDQMAVQVGELVEVSGDPRVVWEISQPSGSGEDTLQIREIRNGVSTAHQVRSDASADEMAFSYYNGAYSKVRKEEVDAAAGTRVLTETLRDSSDAVLSKSVETYTEFAWGEELVSRVEDPDGASEVTTYTYNSASASLPGYGQVDSIVYPDGSWVAYDYNSHGKVTHRYRPWQNAPSTPAEATLDNCAVSITEYSGGLFQTTVDSREERILGQRVSYVEYERSYSSLNGEPTESVKTIRHLATGATQVTEQVSYRSSASDHLSGKTVSSRSADGIIWTYEYEQGSWDAATELFTTGAGEALQVTRTQTTLRAPTGIAGKTLRGITVTDESYNLVYSASAVYDGTGYVTTGETVSTYDSYRNQLTQTVNGALVAESTYELGVLQSRTDASGIETTYTYDAAGRVATETKVGLAPEPDVVAIYTYDEAGRVQTRTRSAGSLSETESYLYYGNGKLKSRSNALGETTSYSYDEANRITTETRPGGITVVTENYLDGQLKSVTGEGTVPQYYSYSVDAEGNRMSEVRQGTIDSPRWSRSTRNWLGQTVKTEQPAFDGTVLTTETFYTSTGRVIKRSTPGQAPTLTTYDGLGQVVLTGLDVDGDGVLRPASTDRITLSENYYSLGGASAEQISRRSTFRIDGSGVPSLLTETRRQLTNLPAGVHGLTRVTDANGVQVTTQREVDRASKRSILRTFSTEIGRSVEQVYTNGLLRSANSAQVFEPTTYTYDELGRQYQVTDPLTGATTYNYTPLGQLDNMVNSDSVTVASYTYYPSTHQNAGQVASLTDAAGQTTYYTYNERGQLTHQWGVNTYPLHYTYDAYGQRSEQRTYRTEDSSVDWSSASWPTNSGAGDLTQWIYQPATGLLSRKEYADANGTDYTYDSANRLSTRSWARGITTSYAYSVTTGDLLGIDYSDSTPDVSYTYNRQGQQSTISDGSGTRSLDHTVYGALRSEAYSVGDLSGYQIELGYDDFGRHDQLKLTDPSDSVLLQNDLSYDTSSRIASISQGSLRIHHGYHPAGDVLIQRRYEDGGSPVYQHDSSLDSLGRLASISYAAGDGRVVSHIGYSYDSSNRRSQATQQNDDTWSYAYNDRSEVTEGKRQLADGSLQAGLQFEYRYDTIGNRLSASTGGDSAGNNLREQAYTPNALNQYTAITTPAYLQITGEANAAASVTVNAQATDRQGNYFRGELNADNSTGPVYQAIDVDGTRSGYTPMETTGSLYLPAANVSPTYDADGNLTQDARWTYTWNGENRLVAMETHAAAYLAGAPRQKLEFGYDSQGRRFSKTVSDWDEPSGLWSESSSSLYLHNQWNLIAELKSVHASPFSLQTSYLWGNDLSGSQQGAGGVGGLLAVTDSASSTAYPFYDGNGNVMGYYDAAAAETVAEFEYGPFGELIRATGSKKNDFQFRFSTKYEDSETGLLYYGFRYYDPVTGRWASRDPIGERGGLNIYAMVNNDLVNHLDLLGLWDISRDVSKRWATVTAEDGDTIASLAAEIGLEESEVSEWLMDMNGDSQDTSVAEQEGCKSKIPNVAVLYTSKPSSIWDRAPWHAFQLNRRFVRSAADGFRDEGYKVIRRENASDSAAFIGLWQEDGIAAFLFTGHGIEGTSMYLSDPDNEGGAAPYDVSPPYKLGAIVALFCRSAEDSLPAISHIEVDFARYWSELVSQNGLFIGFTQDTGANDIIFGDPWDIRNGR